MQETHSQNQHQQLTLFPPSQKQNRIHVFVRVKPLSFQESKFERNKYWQVTDKTVTNCLSKETYNFDRVFDEKMTTSEIFEGEAKKLVLAALDGYNVTIFAYGQTASGKTFTMRGSEHNNGIIPLALQEIFNNLYENYGVPMNTREPSPSLSSHNGTIQKTWNVKVSYIEIYNENINDLLDANHKNLNVRENQQGKVSIEGLSEYEVSNMEDTMFFLKQGDEQRNIAATKINEKSSRSHTVFQVNITMSEKNTQTGRNLIKSSQINLVDLAGSEGASKTQSEGIRFREGSNINKSLLALSRVIQMLGQKYQNGAVKQNYHINFRDSKLTRILQSALQGNSMTSIICTMSQIFNNISESRETLNFGAKAKNIKTIVNINEIVKESPEEIAQKMQKLTLENEELKMRLMNHDELIQQIERDKEEYATLGHLKAHQDLLMQMNEDKNKEIQRNNEEITLKEEKLKQYQQIVEKLEKENFKFSERLEEVNSEMNEKQMQIQMLQQQQQEYQVKIKELNEMLDSLTIQNQQRNREEITMMNIYEVQQQSKIDISNTSLLSSDNNDPSEQKSSDVEKFNQMMLKENLQFISEIENLKSVIKLVTNAKEELQKQLDEIMCQVHDHKDQLNQEKSNNLRLMQQLRAFKIDLKKKDKIITKKNFQISGLIEKIEVLEKANASLFRELDQTIQDCSVIQNQSHYMDAIEEEEKSIDDENGVQRTPQPDSRASLINQIQEPGENNLHLSQTLLNAHHKAQLLELMTRVELLQSEKNNLETEKVMLQNDLDEAHKNIERLVTDMKENDYNFMEVMDDNEEIENQYDALYNEFKRNEEVVECQKEAINQLNLQVKKMENLKQELQSEIEHQKYLMEEKDQIIKEQDDMIKVYKLESKKRTRQEFEEGQQSTQADLQDRKKLKLNDGKAKPGNNQGANQLKENQITMDLIDYQSQELEQNKQLFEQLESQFLQPPQSSKSKLQLIATRAINDSNKENANKQHGQQIPQKLPFNNQFITQRQQTPFNPGKESAQRAQVDIKMLHQFNLGRAEKLEDLTSSARGSKNGSQNSSQVSNYKI